MAASWLKSTVGSAVSSAVGSLSGSLSERAPSLSSALKASAQQLQTAAQAVASSSAVQQLHDRLSGSHELHFAVERVQAAVASARGADRLALLQHWVALLKGSGEGDGTGASAYPPAACTFYANRDGGVAAVSFREVLLASRAPESLAARLVDEPLPFEEERHVLASLLSLLLLGGDETASPLLERLLALATALAGCSAEVRSDLSPLAEEAVATLKVPPEEETCRSEALRASLALAEASAAAESDDPQQGALALPAARSLHAALLRSHQLLAGLAAAAPLGGRAEALRASAGETAERLLLVDGASAEAATRVTESEKLLTEKLEKSDGAASVLRAELGTLQATAAALRAQLEASEEAEARCAAKLNELVEEREAFAAGLREALQGLNATRSRLVDEQGELGGRAKALEAAQALAGAVEARRVAALAQATQAAQQAASTGAAKHLSALLARCSGRAAESSLLLSRLRFCSASLAECAQKQEQSTELGMLDVAKEARAQRLTLERQYEDAEGAMRSLLAEAAALRAEAAEQAPKPAAPLQAALAQLAAADAEFASRVQPPRLQEPAAALEPEILEPVVEMEPVTAEEVAVPAAEEEVAAPAPAAAPAAPHPPAPVATLPSSQKKKKPAKAAAPEAPPPPPPAPEAASPEPAAKTEDDDDWGLN